MSLDFRPTVIRSIEEKGIEVSSSEIETLLLSLDNKTAKEVGQILSIDDNTVRKRLGKVYEAFEPYGAFGNNSKGKGKLLLLKQWLIEQDLRMKADDIREQRKKEMSNVAKARKNFFGRESDIEQLVNYITDSDEPAKVVAVVGIGGIGKTTLVNKLLEEQKIQERFGNKIVWHSLHTEPTVEETTDILLSRLQYLNQTDTKSQESNTAENTTEGLKTLIKELKRNRTLLVIDNVETILGIGDDSGDYKPGHERYEDLFKFIAEGEHESCCILTSREVPPKFYLLEIKSLPVIVYKLPVLKTASAQKLFYSVLGPASTQELFNGGPEVGVAKDPEEFNRIYDYYSGTPLILKIVAATVKAHFAGNITEFCQQLPEKKEGIDTDRQIYVISAVEELLDEQFHRLEIDERIILYWLAISGERVSLLRIKKNNDINEGLPENIQCTPYIVSEHILTTLTSLQGRALIESEHYELTPILRHFYIEKLIEEHLSFFKELDRKICEQEKNQEKGQEKNQEENEFLIEDLDLLELSKIVDACALVQASNTKLIIEYQKRLILKKLANAILNEFDSKARIEKILDRSISFFRETHAKGYGVGNIVNLYQPLGLLLPEIDLHKGNLSNCTIREADLEDIELHETDFSESIIINCTFKEHIDTILSMAFHPIDTNYLVTGGADGKVCIWDVSSNGFKLKWRNDDRHKNWVRTVAFNHDGTIFATAGDDYKIILWEWKYPDSNPKEIQFLPESERAHENWITSIVFHPQENILVSGGQDRKLKIWKQTEKTWEKEKEFTCNMQIWSADFSEDGKLLAIGGDLDRAKKNENSSAIGSDPFYFDWNVAVFEFDNQNHKLTLLDYQNEENINEPDNTKARQIVYSVKFNPNPVSDINPVSYILFAVNDEPRFQKYSVSNSKDKKNYKVSEEYPASKEIKYPKFTKAIRSISLHNNGSLLAAIDDDGKMIILNLNSGAETEENLLFKSLGNKDNRGWACAFQPKSNLLVSSAEDNSLTLLEIKWDDENKKNKVENIQILKATRGYTNGVWSVAFIKNDKHSSLVSGHDNGLVSIWNRDRDSDRDRVINRAKAELDFSNQYFHHTSRVWSIAVSSDGKFFASGSDDRTVIIWDASNDRISPVQKIDCTAQAWSVSFSNDGKYLAVGCDDAKVRTYIFDKDTDEFKTDKTFEEPTSRVWSVSFSKNQNETNKPSEYLASSDDDGNIHIWHYHYNENDGLYKFFHTETNDSDRIWDIIFTRNNEKVTIATAHDNGKVKLWSVNKETQETQKIQKIKEIDNHQGKRVWCVRVSPDGKILASCSDDGTIHLYGLKEDGTTSPGKKITHSFKKWVCKITFYKETEEKENEWMLASASRNGSIKVWKINVNDNSEIEVNNEENLLQTLRVKRPYEGLNIYNAYFADRDRGSNSLKTLGAIDKPPST
jgi:WD40 repeat protein